MVTYATVLDLYDEQVENGKLTVKLKRPKMTIRTHPLRIDTDGKLKDTSENAIPNSPECKFAADLTTYYDEIGKHFPCSVCKNTGNHKNVVSRRYHSM